MKGPGSLGCPAFKFTGRPSPPAGSPLTGPPDSDDPRSIMKPVSRRLEAPWGSVTVRQWPLSGLLWQGATSRDMPAAANAADTAIMIPRGLGNDATGAANDGPFGVCELCRGPKLLAHAIQRGPAACTCHSDEPGEADYRCILIARTTWYACTSASAVARTLARRDRQAG